MTDLSELELSTRASNVLMLESITTLKQLSTFSAAELLRFPNFGRKTLKEIECLLLAHGLELRGGFSIVKKHPPRAEPSGYFWTHDRMAEATALLEAGLSSNEVARRLGKTGSNSGANMLVALRRYGYYSRDENTLVKRLYKSSMNAALCQEAAARIQELEKRQSLSVNVERDCLEIEKKLVAQAALYFGRSKKYEQALREILSSARLVGDYHHVKIARAALGEDQT